MPSSHLQIQFERVKWACSTYLPLNFVGWTLIAAPFDGPLDKILDDVPLDRRLGATLTPPLDEKFGMALVPLFDMNFKERLGDVWATCHNRDVIALADVLGTTAPADGKLGDV